MMPNSNKRIFMIADVHISPSRPDVVDRFCRFCDSLNEGDSLYILGDLFEFWYEYRLWLLEDFAASLKAIKKTTERGVLVYVINGNRDFSYGDVFKSNTGATSLGDIHSLQDIDTVIMHGDLLCTEDYRYLLWRKLVRSKISHLFFRAIPGFVARWLIQRLINSSARNKLRKKEWVMSLQLSAAAEYLDEYKCNILICGHHHDASEMEISENRKLYVIGAWENDTPAPYLEVNTTSITRHVFA